MASLIEAIEIKRKMFFEFEGEIGRASCRERVSSKV